MRGRAGLLLAVRVRKRKATAALGPEAAQPRLADWSLIMKSISVCGGGRGLCVGGGRGVCVGGVWGEGVCVVQKLFVGWLVGGS